MKYIRLIFGEEGGGTATFFESKEQALEESIGYTSVVIIPLVDGLELITMTGYSYPKITTLDLSNFEEQEWG